MLARVSDSISSGGHVRLQLIAPRVNIVCVCVYGGGGGGQFLLQCESWSLHQHALLWSPQ